MRKIKLLLLIAFSAATVNSFAAPKQDKDKTQDKNTAKCKLTSGTSCCKKSSSRVSLLNAKPAAATVAKTGTTTKTITVKATAAKTTTVKKAA